MEKNEMAEKENQTAWIEFTDELDESLKSINLMNEENYTYQKKIQYKQYSEYISLNDNYFQCSCGDISFNKSKFCTKCGNSQITEYRQQHICHHCKITFNGLHCPECGKQEGWYKEQIQLKKEKEEAKRLKEIQDEEEKERKLKEQKYFDSLTVEEMQEYNKQQDKEIKANKKQIRKERRWTGSWLSFGQTIKYWFLFFCVWLIPVQFICSPPINEMAQIINILIIFGVPFIPVLIKNIISKWKY
jgi:RNA polymerase subunit RPABC4/transcription elongation factor Spt4